MPPHKALATTLILLITMPAVLGAVSALANEVSSSGQFSIGNQPPAEPLITLYQDDEQTTTTQMDPQTEYAIKITASDANGYDDIKMIIVHIYYSTTTDGSAEPPTEVSPQNYAEFNWTKGNGWILVGPTGSTWEINTSSSRGPVDVDASTTTAVWWLHFKPSKVATETATGTWYIKVEVYDEAGSSNSSKTWGYSMNWYGEIGIDSNDLNFNFGIVNLGDSNKTLSTPSDGYLDLYVVSNGDFKIQVKAADKTGTSDYWIGKNTRDQAKIVTSDPGVSQIRLKVDTDANPAGATPINPQSAGYNDWYTGDGPTADGDATSGAGAHITAYLYLDVGPSGLLPDVYEGSVYFQVANG